jgi:hypothetical protein
VRRDLSLKAVVHLSTSLWKRQIKALDAVQRGLARHLSRRYYVAASQTERFVAVAYRAASEVGLDPLLVLAVISIESRFNPIAESAMGAKGLMQIIPKYHRAKLDLYAVSRPCSTRKATSRSAPVSCRNTCTAPAPWKPAYSSTTALCGMARRSTRRR